ncbi:MAG: ABC transporter permease [Bacteriovorax sp.]|jgi:ABC-type transport system involved in multi-copper enzyme maturation permease subunit
MKKTFIVAKYTFIEVYRSKVMLSILFIAIGLVIISYIASEFAYGAPSKVALDFGFGLTAISNLFMAIFIGSTLLSKEIENRTLYMILSRPISRTSFMVGKLIGLSSVLVINTILLSLISVGIYEYLGGKLNFLMFWTAWFSLIEAFIVMLFSILFSLVTSNALAIIYTFILWIVGHSLSATSKLFFAKANMFFNYILKMISAVIPDLEKINLKDLLIYEQTVPASYLINTQIYVSIYIIAVLLIISYLFKNKNLD